ncbi:hypothetical protein K439DRAFT_1658810 [Ramaria rubella]|nr:hypothetical protein K439DRAFT_1658810 [Ramaria rubella]
MATFITMNSDNVFLQFTPVAAKKWLLINSKPIPDYTLVSSFSTALLIFQDNARAHEPLIDQMGSENGVKEWPWPFRKTEKKDIQAAIEFAENIVRVKLLENRSNKCRALLLQIVMHRNKIDAHWRGIELERSLSVSTPTTFGINSSTCTRLHTSRIRDVTQSPTRSNRNAIYGTPLHFPKMPAYYDVPESASCSPFQIVASVPKRNVLHGSIAIAKKKGRRPAATLKGGVRKSVRQAMVNLANKGRTMTGRSLRLSK